VPLTGAGTVSVDDGRLDVSGTAGSAARFVAAAGAELLLTGTGALASGAQLDDGVVLRATMTLAGDVRVTGAVRLEGTVLGPGDLRVEDTLSWATGRIAGDGLLAIAAGGRLRVITASFVNLGRPLRNDGELSWESGTFALEHGALIDNYATFNAGSDGWISGGAEAAIHNRGTLVSAPSGPALVMVPVENDGVLVARSGSLRLDGLLTQTIDGELRLEPSSAGVGVLDARGGARLQGTLRVAPAPGTTFLAGQRLLFLSGTVRGRFDRLLGDPGGGLAFGLEYGATEARLLVIGPPAEPPATAVEPGPPSAAPAPRANRAPLARGERYRARAGRRVRLRLLANDRDPDGDRLRVVVLAGPRVARDGKLVLRARRTVRIRYVVVDESGARSAPATATIRVVRR
jgi:hypothetical protein